MYIDQIMTREVISVKKNSRINEMLELMQTHRLQHLPVVNESNELLGIVAHQDIQKAGPSTITTLSVGEANYLLAKVTAAQIMQDKVVSCNSNTLIEVAGQLLRDNGISSLPVLQDDLLVGIVTMEDILDFFLDLTGCRQKGATRVAIRVSDEKGSLSQLINIINDLGGYIATIVSPTELDKDGKRVCIVRYYADDPHRLDLQLKQFGIEIISENFLAEPEVEIRKNDSEPVVMTQEEQIASFISQNDQLFSMMSMQLLSVKPGYCQLSMKILPQLLNAAGVLHGAAGFALADVAVAIASNSYNRMALSLESSMKYLVSCKEGEHVIATTKEISLGQRIAHYQVELRQTSDDALIAIFNTSVFRKTEALPIHIQTN